MSFFFVSIWVGGIGITYRRNRDHGVGVVFSALECLFWPIGLGHTIAARFYHNTDWDRSS